MPMRVHVISVVVLGLLCAFAHAQKPMKKNQVIFTEGVSATQTFSFQKEHKLRLKKGEQGIFLYDPNNFPTGHAQHYFGEWDIELLTVADPILEEGDTVIDVGAHQGEYTVPFAQMVGSKGLVYAFEPQRFSYQLLGTNVVLNELSNVHSYHALLGHPGAEGQIITIGDVMDSTARYNANSTAAPSSSKSKVRVTTIDALNVKEVRLIKIDTDTMNYEVLLGAEKTIRRHRPAIIMENHDQEMTPTLQILNDFGFYDLYRFLFNTKLAKKMGWEYADSNLVAIPRDDDSFNLDDFPPGMQKIGLRDASEMEDDDF